MAALAKSSAVWVMKLYHLPGSTVQVPYYFHVQGLMSHSIALFRLQTLQPMPNLTYVPLIFIQLFNLKILILIDLLQQRPIFS